MTTTAVAPTQAGQEDTSPGAVGLDEGQVHELATSLARRLVTTEEAEIERLVRAALTELMPVRVTTYLPVLVGRRVRHMVRAGVRADAALR